MRCIHRITAPALSALLAASLFSLAGCSLDQSGVDADQTTLTIVTPGGQELPADARAALVEAIVEANRDQPEAAREWLLTGLRWEQDWALATLAPGDRDQQATDDDETHAVFDSLQSALLVRTEYGWEAALEGDAYVRELLPQVPTSEFGEDARAAIFPDPDQVRIASDVEPLATYKFFWPAGQPWAVTQGWHDPVTWGNKFPAYHSLDFDLADGSSNSDILAGAGGTVSKICDDGHQVLIGITTGGYEMGYLHLDSASVAAAGIGTGSQVSTGTKLGRMWNTDGGAQSTICGTSYATHLHMYFPYRPITIEDVMFTSNNWHSGELLYSSQGSSPPPPPPSGEVIVDDLSGGFSRFGPSGYWWQASIGYNSHMYYTYVNGTIKSNFARWTPNLPNAGNYSVYAHIPYNHATSQQATYRIYHAGTNSYATVNQTIYYDEWVYLGRYYFSDNGAEYVELSDATGESGSTGRKIGFDAVKFVP